MKMGGRNTRRHASSDLQPALRSGWSIEMWSESCLVSSLFRVGYASNSERVLQLGRMLPPSESATSSNEGHKHHAIDHWAREDVWSLIFTDFRMDNYTKNSRVAMNPTRGGGQEWVGLGHSRLS